MQLKLTRRARAHRSGYTLTELMIVVSLIGVLQAIAVPNYARARERCRATSCIANLKQIETAKEQWALETRAARAATPDAADLYGPTLYLRSAPRCPSGGDYTIGSLTSRPVCDVSTNGTPADAGDDHKLP